MASTSSIADLLTAFRSYYYQFTNAVRDAVISNSDAVVLARLGDDVDQYMQLVNQVRP